MPSPVGQFFAGFLPPLNFWLLLLLITVSIYLAGEIELPNGETKKRRHHWPSIFLAVSVYVSIAWLWIFEWRGLRSPITVSAPPSSLRKAFLRGVLPFLVLMLVAAICVWAVPIRSGQETSNQYRSMDDNSHEGESDVSPWKMALLVIAAVVGIVCVFLVCGQLSGLGQLFCFRGGFQILGYVLMGLLQVMAH